MPGFQNDAGVQQQEAGFGFAGRLWTESFNNITAKVGGGLAGATLVDSMFVSATVTNPNDSVVLPPVSSFPGGALIICVQNISVNQMQVFAQGTDTINGQPGSTGVMQMGNSIAYYQCTKAGTWQATGLGVGFGTGPGLSASFPTYSTQTGVTASATQTAAGGTIINATQAQITTVAVAGNAVTLPPAKPGMEITLVNNAGANAAGVFGATQAQGGQGGGDTVNGLLTAFSLAITTPVIFYCFVAGNWITK